MKCIERSTKTYKFNSSCNLVFSNMSVKVHNMDKKDIENNKISPSNFTRLVRFLSKVFLLPIGYNKDFTKVEFKVFSIKSVIWSLIFSTPIISTTIWYSLKGHFNAYITIARDVYTPFDLYFMVVLQTGFVLPLELIFPIFTCKLWRDFPELSLANDLKMSRKKSLLGLLLIFAGSGILLSLGNYLTIGKRMTEISQLEVILTHLAYIVPFLTNRFLDVMNLSLILALIQTMTQKIEKPPVKDKDIWIFNTMTLYDRFQKQVNSLTLIIIPVSQVIWIMFAFLSVGLSFGTKNVDTPALSITMFAYFSIGIGFLILTKVLLFAIHDLKDSLINIQVKSILRKSSANIFRKL